jgi:hypothetical protein
MKMGKVNSIDAVVKIDRINKGPISSIIKNSKEKILFILQLRKMKTIEKIFYKKISNLKKEEKYKLLIEMEKIIKDSSKIDLFISNISVILAEKN